MGCPTRNLPVKNWIKMGQNHSAKPVFFPAALKKTCAAGLPRGDAKVSSTLPAQNPRAILSITPTTCLINCCSNDTPREKLTHVTRTAWNMATGPLMAALCNSSLI